MVSEDPKSFEARLRRLARSIETLAEKDERALRRTREIAELRRRAASEIFSVCQGFVDALNRMLSGVAVALDPPEFRPEYFHEDRSNLIQMNFRGRILQVEFAATPEPLSTEDFRIPYTLGGSVRAFNQALLEKNLVEEQLLFYTVEPRRTMWRYFDVRTYRSGEFGRDYLIGLMDRLV